MECKCKGCTKRVLNCHSTCEDYKQYQEYNEKRKKDMKMNNVHSSTGWGYIPRRINKER